jgi:hypothetical protein
MDVSMDQWMQEVENSFPSHAKCNIIQVFKKEK